MDLSLRTAARLVQWASGTFYVIHIDLHFSSVGSCYTFSLQFSCTIGVALGSVQSENVKSGIRKICTTNKGVSTFIYRCKDAAKIDEA
jgi:hypothetical protein